VATDWAPVVQTSIGAVAAIGGGFVGAWWQSKSQHRIEHDRKRERAAELAGTALQLHIDSSAYALGRRPGRDATQAAIDELQRRHAQVRAQLWMVAGSHPSEEVRRLARTLPLHLNKSLNAATDYVMECINHSGRSHSDAWRAADRTYREALDATAKLLMAIERS
jgi:hypothetical protein